jgi:hypothetical protein
VVRMGVSDLLAGIDPMELRWRTRESTDCITKLERSKLGQAKKWLGPR